jgi:hypothetical protein
MLDINEAVLLVVNTLNKETTLQEQWTIQNA